MSSTSAAPCVVILNQQQKQEIDELCQSKDILGGQNNQKSEYCTVVENGKVVVKAIKELKKECC